jgi:uncharacterized membrane protein YgdD (TMEM256/DUF423 family)
MKNNYITLAGIIGAITVALGAFGAHALKDKIEPVTLDIYKTAVLYQFIHVLALLGTGILCKFYPNKTMQWAGGLFVAGIVLFSGSLYALVFILNSGSNGLRWLGAITPVGGLCFIAGWLCLAFGAKKAA